MMDLLKQIVGWVIALAFIVMLLGLLWAIIRFALMSDFITRGFRDRLRNPQMDKVGAKWSVRLPPELEEFYRTARFIRRTGFYLRRPGSPESARWRVDEFIPLTVRDLNEWRKVTGVPGLPIAVGGEDGKATYYLPMESLRAGVSPPVMYQSPEGPDVEVASTIEDLIKFEPERRRRSKQE